MCVFKIDSYLFLLPLLNRVSPSTIWLVAANIQSQPGVLLLHPLIAVICHLMCHEYKAKYLLSVREGPDLAGLNFTVTK